MRKETPCIKHIQKTNRSITIKKLNYYVKVVCKFSGIDSIVKGTKLNTETNRKELGITLKYELIASHCFRRSFATKLLKKSQLRY